jgi:hypothetical protein
LLMALTIKMILVCGFQDTSFQPDHRITPVGTIRVSLPSSGYTQPDSVPSSDYMSTIVWIGSVYMAAPLRGGTEIFVKDKTTQHLGREELGTIRLHLYTYWLTEDRLISPSSKFCIPPASSAIMSQARSEVLSQRDLRRNACKGSNLPFLLAFDTLYYENFRRQTDESMA